MFSTHVAFLYAIVFEGAGIFQAKYSVRTGTTLAAEKNVGALTGQQR